jgi:hypothetical protein
MIITAYDAFILGTVFTMGLLCGYGVVTWVIAKYL